MKPVQKILVIDDESDVGEFISAAAEAMGLECIATTEATAFLAALTPDTTLILIDLLMPKMDGVELLRLLGQRKCKAGIILMSGVGKRTLESAGQLAEVLGLAIVGHLQKPFRLAQLESVLQLQAEPAPPPTPLRPPQPLIADDELRRAIVRNEFVLHYQPQIHIPTGRVIGLEALVRWLHPDRGLIFPDSFIPRLEQLHLIDDLGWIVADRAMSEIPQFNNSDGPALLLSINESVDSLQDLKFPDRFVSLAEMYGVAPANLTVEITESGLIRHLSKTLDILTRLCMKHVRLSIDDFGTGFAMMQQIQNIPATELKIDKSFVMQMSENERDRIMVQKTIEMGHELGMTVIAEGVETKLQLDFLRLHHCDSAQGYFFTPPPPPPALLAWLATYRSQLLHCA